MIKRDADLEQDAAGEDACGVFVFDEDRVRRVRAAMYADEVVDELAERFKLLGNDTRLRIVRALSTVEELCVCDLAVILDISVSAVSHQLRALRRERLVRARAEGKLAYYRIADPAVIELLDAAVRQIRPAEAP